MRVKGIVPPSSEPRTPPPPPPPAPPQDPAHPTVGMVDTPTVTVLRGMTVPAFEAEMQLMNQALGVSCNHCHVRANFAAEDNPRKAIARRMLEMTRTLNQQFFPNHQPAEGESRLGKVTCFTCHQGTERPKAPAY
jgi:photosynthetic reaction center cytochrome c subunit